MLHADETMADLHASPGDPSPPSQPRRSAIGDAMATHREMTDLVLSEGEPVEIKKLYVKLGDLLESAVGSDVDSIPVLSFPENAHVVCEQMSAVRGRILDAGCGPNPATAIGLAGRPGRSVVLLDIGLGMVRLARARAAADGLSLPGVVADVEALPFRDASFDAFVCDDTIEHVPNDEAGIDELARVARPGATCVLATPNRRRLDVLVRRVRDMRRARRLPASAYYAATSHLREYTWTGLERLVSPRFEVRGRVTIGWSGGWRARLASRLVGRAPFRRLGRMVILVLSPRHAG